MSVAWACLQRRVPGGADGRAGVSPCYWKRPFRRTLLSLLPLTVLACGFAAAQPPPTFVKTIGTNTSASTGTSISITVPAAGVAQDNTVIVALATIDGTGSVSCSDSRSNTYSVDADANNDKGIRTVVCSAYVSTALVSGDSITVTHPSAGPRAVSANEFSGIASSGRVDQTSTNTAKDLNLTSGTTAMTAQDIELLFGAFGVLDIGTRTFTPGTNYTLIGPAGSSGSPERDIFPEGRFVSATGTYAATATLSGSREYAGAIVTYKAALATAVDLVSVRATAGQRGVLLRWRSGYEVDNLGFHVYREGSAGLKRLTPRLLGGTALLAGAGTPLAGWSYRWRDEEGRRGDRYWLQDFDLQGEASWHGPVLAAPRESGEEDAAAERRPLAARAAEKTRVESHRREVRAPAPERGGARQRRQRELAAGEALKIGIEREGWYRLQAGELVEAGLPPQVDPRRLQLFVDGEEVPLRVTGEEDGFFDASDAIEFYGQGLDTPWSETRTYWLVEGAGRGRRVSASGGAPHGEGGPAHFPYPLEWRQHSIYAPSLRRGEGNNFFGAVITDQPQSVDLDVHHLDPAASWGGTLQIEVQGFSRTSHQVRVQLNGVELERLVFAGQEGAVAEVALPARLLEEGVNLVTLVAEGDDTDVSLLESIRLTYPHTFRADAERLFFPLPGTVKTSRRGRKGALRSVVVGGFRDPAIRVLDVTDPGRVREIPARVEPEGETFAVRFGVMQAQPRRFLAVGGEGMSRPATVTANRPSSWHRGAGAEVVMVSHGEFLPALQPLVELRQSEGWSVARIDVEDLYDEFAFGHRSPWAIREFLRESHRRWKEQVQFVLLVGDATYDPRNLQQRGKFDFVPTKLIDTRTLETASDDWFGDFDGDGVPSLAIGRLPVRTAEQAAATVAKIVDHARAPGGGRRRVLLVADRPEGFDFPAGSRRLAELVPPELEVVQVLRGSDSDASVREALLQQLGEGALIVDYFGHGSLDVWAGGVLSSSDAAALPNRDQPFFLMAMTCLNGAFQSLDSEGLAEALLVAEGGAMAAWAASGLVNPSGQADLHEAMLPLLLAGHTLGEAALRAKAAVDDRDIRRSWILLGDPVTRLPVP